MPAEKEAKHRLRRYSVAIVAVILGIVMASFLSGYIARMLTGRFAMGSQRGEYIQLREELRRASERTQQLLAETQGSVTALRGNVNRLTTDAVRDRLAYVDFRINQLSAQLDSLQQVISPRNASEILTVARMRQEILAREQYEKRVDERVNNFEERIGKTNEEVSSIRYWIWTTLVLLVGGLVAVAVFLSRKLAGVMTLLGEIPKSESHPSG